MSHLTKLSLANVCPVSVANDELWVGADLLRSPSSGENERLKTGWFKGQVKGDTYSWGRCVHIPAILIRPV